MTSTDCNAIAINALTNVSVKYIGIEQTPVLIIDEFFSQCETLINNAAHNFEQTFHSNPKDYYPGVRKTAPQQYSSQLCKQLETRLQKEYSDRVAPNKTLSSLLSAFSLTCTAPEDLRPIQMLPHFDSPAKAQFAVVHYLCDSEFGGTAFYRHQHTQFETVTTERLAQYGQQLKKEAIEQNLHHNPHYINDDSCLFEKIGHVEAKVNRAVVYPANLLHSGNINTTKGLSSNPRDGRLTINSFVSF